MPRLASALLHFPAGAHVSLPLFCYVMIRQALRGAGEDDRGMADYVTSIVVHFGMAGRANRIGMADDETYSTLVDLVDDVNDPDANRSFLVRTHLGNYALWLSVRNQGKAWLASVLDGKLAMEGRETALERQ